MHVSDIDAMAVGPAVWRLGAVRAAPGERCQSAPGCESTAGPGTGAAGEPLFTLYTDTSERFAAALVELDGGWSVGEEAPAGRPLIIDRITGDCIDDR